MFKSLRKIRGGRRSKSIMFEALETRQLLSASLPGQNGPGGHGGVPGPGGGPPQGPGGGPGGPGGPIFSTIEFSLAPTAVQTGLDALATADGFADPTSTQLVSLNNVNGVETYSVTITSTGTVSRLTVDQNGKPITQPTQSTTTWAALTSNEPAAATEISAIASALSLTAPTATTVVNVTTTSTGAVTYAVTLSPSSTSSDDDDDNYRDIPGIVAVVDAAGNPIGNQRVPFSVLPGAIQTALNNHAPTGATALVSTSTQSVNIRTVDGVVTYSVPFTVSGTTTTVTVDLAGDLVNLPSTSTSTFGDLSSIVQSEIQTLATADGVTGTISSTQSVTVLTETNGTILYSVTVTTTGTDSSETSHTYNITLTVDADGNPTTLPNDLGDHGKPAPPPPDPGDDASGSGDDDDSNTPGSSSSDSDAGSSTPVACPPDSSDSSDSGSGSSDSGDSSSGSGSSTSIGSNDGSTTTESSISLNGASVLSSISSPAVYGMIARVLASETNGLGALAGVFVEFIPADVDSAVQADLSTLQTNVQQTVTDLKGLDKSDRATLQTDLKAIQTAIKAINSTLAPLEATFKTDAATWNATVRSDKKAIRKDRNDAAALASDQSKLKSDQAAAFTALATDAMAIVIAINGDSGVAAAQEKLATDLPTIAADQTAVTTDLKQLVTDIESQFSAV